MTWRHRAHAVIVSVLAATRGEDERTVRRALRAAYPFGERTNWPYRVWLDEIKVQRGLKRRRARGVLPGQLVLPGVDMEVKR